MSIAFLVLLLGFTLPVVTGLRIVPERQRFLVFRFGQMHSVLQPGLRWVLPGLDHVLRIDLNRYVPEWQSLGEWELDERLRQLYLTGQL